MLVIFVCINQQCFAENDQNLFKMAASQPFNLFFFRNIGCGLSLLSDVNGPATFHCLQDKF